MLIAVSSSDVEEKHEKEEAEHLIEFDDGLNEKNLLLVVLKLKLKLESLGSDEGSETEQWIEEAIVATQHNCFYLIYSKTNFSFF